MISTHTVVDAARSFEGTPFVHQGRLPGVGLDCGGVVICAYREAGLHIVDSVYQRVPRRGQLAKMASDNRFWVVRDIEDGDVLFFCIHDATHPMHLGIVDGVRFWHVMEGGDVTSDPIELWRSRMLHCMRRIR